VALAIPTTRDKTNATTKTPLAKNRVAIFLASGTPGAFSGQIAIAIRRQEAMNKMRRPPI
jgi:hypothetical protein